uniref:Uncharacterized protein n=1 Tax=Chenopodium quinoa TaxID=63459 RepID=A0A803LNH3_CHEQI
VPLLAQSNPSGAERLPPGIFASKSDLYLRRLWGLPSEDLKTKPKYLVTFTIGLDMKENIDKAVKKFSDNFTILLFHYDGKTTSGISLSGQNVLSIYVNLVKKHGLEISQPGVDPNSPFTWQMTRKRHDSEVHNGLAIMAGALLTMMMDSFATRHFRKGVSVEDQIGAKEDMDAHVHAHGSGGHVPEGLNKVEQIRYRVTSQAVASLPQHKNIFSTAKSVS